LALILPVLILIILGCIDLGRFAYSYIAITNGARAGAGFGSVNTYTAATYPKWQARVKQAALDEMTDLDSSLLDVPDPRAVNDSTTLWRAEVTVRYTFKTLISWPGIPSTVPMERTVAMRNVR
jgi:Flp pilus assembly protein TadG